MAHHDDENVTIPLDIDFSSFRLLEKFTTHRKILKLIPEYPCLACCSRMNNEFTIRREAIGMMIESVPPMLIPRNIITNTDEKLMEIILERDVSIFDRNLPFALRNNERICEKIVKKDGLKLEVMSLNMKSNENIVKIAVQQNAMALEFAFYKLKRNREIVCLALDQNGMGLKHAAKELRQDLDIVLRAVSRNGDAIYYAMCHRTKKKRSRRKVSLKLNPKVIETAINSGSALAEYAKHVNELREDPNIALQCLRNGNSIYSISVRLMKNTEFATIARQAREEYLQEIRNSVASRLLILPNSNNKTPYESIKEIFINSGCDYKDDPEVIAHFANQSLHSGVTFTRERVLKSIRKIPLTLIHLDYYSDEDEFMEQSLKYLDGTHISLFEDFFAKFFDSNSRMDLLLRSIEENVAIVKYFSRAKIVENYEFMEKVIRIVLKKKH